MVNFKKDEMNKWEGKKLIELASLVGAEEKIEIFLRILIERLKEKKDL